MKKKTSNLLQKAHSKIVSVTGTDVTKSHRAEVMKEVRAIYRKIKDVEQEVDKILNEDENHKKT